MGSTYLCVASTLRWSEHTGCARKMECEGSQQASVQGLSLPAPHSNVARGRITLTEGGYGCTVDGITLSGRCATLAPRSININSGLFWYISQEVNLTPAFTASKGTIRLALPRVRPAGATSATSFPGCARRLPGSRFGRCNALELEFWQPGRRSTAVTTA